MSQPTYILKVVAAVCACILTCCTPDTECRTEEKVHCGIVFTCDSVHQTEDTTYTVSFTNIDSLTVQGLGADSILYYNQATASAYLPLRSDTEKTEYLLHINAREDTLTVLHQNNEYFISLACGCFVYHSIDTAYLSSGDTVEILNSTVENYEQDNLKLHLHF